MSSMLCMFMILEGISTDFPSLASWYALLPLTLMALKIEGVCSILPMNFFSIFLTFSRFGGFSTEISCRSVSRSSVSVNAERSIVV